MLSITDYGEDGIVPMEMNDNALPIVEDIIRYVESRFDILEKEDRLADILSLVEEFREWGDAKEGDVVSYYVCPSFK